MRTKHIRIEEWVVHHDMEIDSPQDWSIVQANVIDDMGTTKVVLVLEPDGEPASEW